MKPTGISHGKLIIGAIAAVVITIGLVSWDYKQSPGNSDQATTDTVPKNRKDREKKVRDLDDVLEELDRAEVELNMNNAKIELNNALEKLNFQDIKLEIEKAMKEVDMEGIKKEIEKSLASVDLEKVKSELAEAMKEVDAAKIQKEIQSAMASVDMKKIQAEMEKVKNIDLEKLQVEMDKVKAELKDIGPEIEKSLEKAKVEIEKAKTEMKEYKAFVDGLDKDGLINKKDEYRIKHEDGKLEINGKKVTDAVYQKYKSFLDKHKEFSIKKTADDFDIDTDNDWE